MSPLNRSTDSIGSRQVVSSEPAATAEAVTEGNGPPAASTAGTLWKSCGRSSRSRYCRPSASSSPGSISRNQLAGGR